MFITTNDFYYIDTVNQGDIAKLDLIRKENPVAIDVLYNCDFYFYEPYSDENEIRLAWSRDRDCFLDGISPHYMAVKHKED